MRGVNGVAAGLMCAAALCAQGPDVPAVRLERISEPVVYEGQLVDVLVRFPPVSAGSTQHYHFAGFVVTPKPKSCGAVDSPCSAEPYCMGDCANNRWDWHADTFSTDLNWFMPALSSGHYTVSAILDEGQASGKPRPNYLVSNTVTFEVQPAPDEWIEQTLKSTRQTLLSPKTTDVERERALHQLAAMPQPEALRTALDLFGQWKKGDPDALLTGIVRNLGSKGACDLALAQARRPGQVLTLGYARFAALMCSDRAVFDQIKTLAEAGTKK